MIKIIEVTEKHIKHGIKNSCENCPVALAIKEATGLEVSVGTTMAKFKYKRIYLPQVVREWIYIFDTSNLSSIPISFEISL